MAFVSNIKNVHNDPHVSRIANVKQHSAVQWKFGCTRRTGTNRDSLVGVVTRLRRGQLKNCC